MAKRRYNDPAVLALSRKEDLVPRGHKVLKLGGLLLARWPLRGADRAGYMREVDVRSGAGGRASF